MKKSLYEIESEYAAIADQLIEAGGEATPELETALVITQEQLQAKGIAYGFIIHEMEADTDIIDSEIKRLQAIRKTRVNAIERLKERLSQAMQTFGILELKTAILKINFRKSESVEISNADLIPADYRRVIPEKSEPDKSAIKEAIKAGIEVPGAIIQQNQNIQIK